MQVSRAFEVLLIVSIILIAESKRECGFVCLEFDWGFGNETIEELVVSNLKKDGPVDGVCVTKDKWMMDGAPFNIPSKCICVDIPTDVYIKPGDGPRCPDICISSPQETAVEAWTRCHDAVKSFAPANGWCPKGSHKWIIQAKRIGRPHENNTCHCIIGNKFASKEVKCIDVPDVEGEL